MDIHLNSLILESVAVTDGHVSFRRILIIEVGLSGHQAEDCGTEWKCFTVGLLDDDFEVGIPDGIIVWADRCGRGRRGEGVRTA